LSEFITPYEVHVMNTYVESNIQIIRRMNKTRIWDFQNGLCLKCNRIETQNIIRQAQLKQMTNIQLIKRRLYLKLDNDLLPDLTDIILDYVLGINYFDINHTMNELTRTYTWFHIYYCDTCDENTAFDDIKANQSWLHCIFCNGCMNLTRLSVIHV
jgi:hypothetical protein